MINLPPYPNLGNVVKEIAPVMGHSIRWYSEEKEVPVPFPEIDWNLQFNEDSFLNCVSGDWEQETGFTRDMVTEMEYIRDYGLRAIYSNWSYQKHHCKNKEKFANLSLKWVSPIGGKREGCRVKGDYVLSQRDLEEPIYHEDGTACITWSIDMHFPEPTNLKEFGEAFRSYAYHRGIGTPYPVPYRCLYAKDVKNLFIGGRLVSTSHVAFNCGIDSSESYHFKDIGWWWIHRAVCEQPEEVEKFKRGVEFLGLPHKYPMPEAWK